ncbi:helix-turn-helix domain-containing protein [Nostoc sp. PCC 7107]|uniref:helix-turn-helix domain-containing protein n=1 Tax=Nostoc sp. PCC 7107 TaxID=317936 RepID=UPI00029F3CBE|nr:helix-turn-helix transcriptional regulator [Nostoc sp. PCC 7107]AFY43255.1 helix-turn-helix domain protein [Nostoc sp. PCC 7107]
MDEAKILSLLGENLRRIRIEKGYSQEQLAALTGLDRTYISGIERGKRNVSLINLVKLARALDIPTKQIVDFDMEGNNV